MNIRIILHCFRRYFSLICLAASWLLGLIAGVSLAVSAGESISQLANVLSAPVSGIGICVSVFLPFCIAALLVCLFSYKWIYPIAGLRALGFAFVGTAINVLYGSAGWLLRLLAQFSGISALPLFFWFSVRRLKGSDTLKTDLLIISVFTVAIAAVDTYLIAPLLQATF